MMAKFNGRSRKSKGHYSGFAKRLDTPDLYDLAIERSANWREEGSSSAWGSITREIVDKSRKSQYNAELEAMRIPPKYQVGAKVSFRLEVDSMWALAPRYTGRIIQRFHNRIWFYVIKDDNGKRYSIEWYKVTHQIHNELMIVQQPVTAIIVLDQPAMAGELAA